MSVFGDFKPWDLHGLLGLVSQRSEITQKPLTSAVISWSPAYAGFPCGHTYMSAANLQIAIGFLLDAARLLSTLFHVVFLNTKKKKIK